MTVTVGTLVGLLAFWMAACCFCGLKGRYVWFAAVLLFGLTLNLIWMMVGLDASIREIHVLVAQISATMYAVIAFVIGRFLGRIRRAWAESAVDEAGI
ncbi:hypothetical protein Z946_3487 [Sulfitobacter noctilucicola]|nr:hypothetical protein [Sulfitobacter noctilucicola]KIN64595.1 hypothetical protein Z946_3487 [Sulfitobacter noctilucicola]